MWPFQALAELERLAVHARTPMEETGLHLCVECGDGLKALRIVKVRNSSCCHLDSFNFLSQSHQAKLEPRRTHQTQSTV